MEKLRAYLCSARVTQRSFADVVGLSRSHLNEIISGRKRPSLDVAFAIARATSGAVPVDAWQPSDDAGCHRDEPTTPNQEPSHDQPQSDAPSDAA
ncbi:helix-turn-helix transcriptional regulator [Paracoccus sp. ME4]|uniref:helix-turn-helix transcriptional regulator n=1 Tax=Paracoccus sp. ME4 TaxID=3138066 RepID=UPI00398B08FC